MWIFYFQERYYRVWCMHVIHNLNVPIYDGYCPYAKQECWGRTKHLASSKMLFLVCRRGSWICVMKRIADIKLHHKSWGNLVIKLFVSIVLPFIFEFYSRMEATNIYLFKYSLLRHVSKYIQYFIIHNANIYWRETARNYIINCSTIVMVAYMLNVQA